APTVVKVGDFVGATIGGRELAVIAGPCSVEGQDMLRTTALAVRSAGARLLRGGAFKPRTSPYAFQGLGRVALRILAEARAAARRSAGARRRRLFRGSSVRAARAGARPWSRVWRSRRARAGPTD